MASKTDVTGRVKTRRIPYDDFDHVLTRIKTVPIKGHGHLSWYCDTCNETKRWVQFKTVALGGKKK